VQKRLSSAVVGLGVTLFLAISTASAVLGAPELRTIYETQKLIAPDPDAGDRFGTAVSVSGNLAIVGSKYDDVGTGAFIGSASIYAFDGTSWNFQAKLSASDGVGFGYFGSAVAISGNMVLVGAPSDSTVGMGSGAVYVFIFDGTAWNQQAKIVDPNEAGGSQFGFSLALSGNTALIGAWNDNNKGAAYIFTFDGTAWSEQAKLTASDGELSDLFGWSVSLSENRALVGAYENDSFTGAAYVFSFDGSTWSQEAKLTGLDVRVGDRFGWAVSISGDVALVGAPDRGHARGAAYIFGFDGATWTQQTKLTIPGATPADSFGSSVVLSDRVALIGAHRLYDSGGYTNFRCVGMYGR